VPEMEDLTPVCHILPLSPDWTPGQAYLNLSKPVGYLTIHVFSVDPLNGLDERCFRRLCTDLTMGKMIETSPAHPEPILLRQLTQAKDPMGHSTGRVCTLKNQQMLKQQPRPPDTKGS